MVVALAACLLLSPSDVLASAGCGNGSTTPPDTDDTPPPESTPEDPGDCGGGGEDESGEDDDDGDCPAPPPPAADTTDGNEGPIYPEGASACGSYINVLQQSYTHLATDYGVRWDNLPGCSACAGGAGPGKPLPSLMIRRLHTPRTEADPVSSLGPGVHLQYLDVYLLLEEDGLQGTGTIQLSDPTSPTQKYFAFDYDPNGTFNPDGVYENNSHSVFRSITLYDNASVVTSDQRLAKTAVLENWIGWKYGFEILPVDPNGGSPDKRFGRVSYIEDRNGNRLEINHEFAASADLTNDLGDDYSKYFRFDTVVDAYGRTATFTYGTAKVGDRWAVSSIALPNGQTLTYTYGNLFVNEPGQPAKPGLRTVAHPDGSTSTFEYQLHGTEDWFNLLIDDPAAGQTHRFKTVSLTASLTPANAGLPPYRVRQLLNGDGEVAFRAKYVNSGNTAYVYRGGSALRAIVSEQGHITETLVKSGTVADVVAATAADPATIGFVSVKAYGYPTDLSTSNYRPQRRIDRLGRVVDYDLRADGAATKKRFYETQADYDAGNPPVYEETNTFNDFKQPLIQTDALGRITERQYDANGNLRFLIRAKGTPEESTWEWQYNAEGQVTKAIDANDNETDHEYSSTGDPANVDGTGYLVRVIEPADTVGGPRAETTFAYDTAGRITGKNRSGGSINDVLVRQPQPGHLDHLCRRQF